MSWKLKLWLKFHKISYTKNEDKTLFFFYKKINKNKKVYIIYFTLEELITCSNKYLINFIKKEVQRLAC